MKTRIIKISFHGKIFTKALLNALCNAIPNAKWESLTPFATFEFDEIG